MSVGHYENFPVASILLPAGLRPDVVAIYRFARAADDIADEGDAPAARRLADLEAFRGKLRAIASGDSPDDPLFRALAQTIRRHDLPLAPFHDLLDAFTQDVTKKRYASFEELLQYCRRSANPVGRLMLHLFKRTTESNQERSDAICTALQLVNFWQDVAIDFAEDDRIYLPQDDMARFGVTRLHLIERTCDGAWRELMRLQVERARALLASGASLGRELPGRLGLEIRATVQGAARILERIEAVGYDVFRRRPVLRALDWPLVLARALR